MKLTLILSAAVLAVSLQPANAADKLRIATEGAYAPWNFSGPNGTLEGFEIDLANDLCKRMNKECEIVAQNWDGIIPSLTAGKYDAIMAGMSITPKREEVIAFSKPYMNNAQLLVVRAESPINDRAGLAGKVIGTQEGSSSIDALEKNAEFKDSLAEVKKYGDFVNAFMDLEIGRTDGILVDSVVGRYYMAKKPGKFKVIDDKMGDEKFGVGMRKEDTLLQDKLNDVLKQMSEDGTMTKLSQKWFNEDITIKVQ